MVRDRSRVLRRSGFFAGYFKFSECNKSARPKQIHAGPLRNLNVNEFYLLPSHDRTSPFELLLRSISMNDTSGSSRSGAGSDTLTFHQEMTKSIPRESDGSAFYVHWSGGIRTPQIDDSNWSIDPVFDGTRACMKGFVTKANLFNFLRAKELHIIAFQSVNWQTGAYHSSWSPFIPGESNHREGPADLWAQIAGNLTSGSNLTLDARA
jgi:hypothetical protein